MSGLGYSTPTAVTRRGLRGWAPRVLALWLGFGLCVVASAAWSQEAAYQGRLTDASGVPLTGSIILLELRIYNDLNAGASLYEEIHRDVPLSDEGVFSVPLGGGVPQFLTYDASLFPGTTPRYLEVRVNNELLSPRQRIGTVPTALVAEEWSGEAGLQSQVTDAQSTADANAAGVSSNATAISGFAVGPHTQDTNTQLIEAQVDAFVANNNFSTGAHTTDTNTQLNEAQVDGFVANNGFGLATDVSANTNGLSNQSSEISALQAQVTFFQTYLDSFCGNEVLEPVIEACDDGNATDDGNGCSASCQANNVCGNGIIESAVETCDDGGTANGDGCSDSCSIEPGSFCNGEPSVCGGRVVNVCGGYCEALNSELCGGIPGAIGICVDDCIQNIEDAEQLDGKACSDAQLATFECVAAAEACEDILAFFNLSEGQLPFPFCTAQINDAVDLCPISIDLVN